MKKDLTDRRFGKLLVLHEGPKLDIQRSDGGNNSWICRCDCGKETTVRTYMLTRSEIGGRHGAIRSCGCERGPEIKYCGAEYARNQYYGEYRAGANNRDLVFELTINQFQLLTEDDCFYCGAEPALVRESKKGSQVSYICNGVDRMDNTKGYVWGNCVPCCTSCNMMKKTLTVDQFVDRIEKVYQRLIA